MEKKVCPEWFYPYLAGFIEGDGSIFCNIVVRPDYTNLFQLSPQISITQKTSKKHVLLWILQNLQKGVLRDRGDGMSEINLSGWRDVKYVLLELKPYIQLKLPQCTLLLHIIELLPKTKNSPHLFIKTCEQVDRLAALNDSRNRVHTSQTVRAQFLQKGIIDG